MPPPPPPPPPPPSFFGFGAPRAVKSDLSRSSDSSAGDSFAFGVDNFRVPFATPGAFSFPTSATQQSQTLFDMPPAAASSTFGFPPSQTTTTSSSKVQGSFGNASNTPFGSAITSAPSGQASAAFTGGISSVFGGFPSASPSSSAPPPAPPMSGFGATGKSSSTSINSNSAAKFSFASPTAPQSQMMFGMAPAATLPNFGYSPAYSPISPSFSQGRDSSNAYYMPSGSATGFSFGQPGQQQNGRGLAFAPAPPPPPPPPPMAPSMFGAGSSGIHDTSFVTTTSSSLRPSSQPVPNPFLIPSSAGFQASPILMQQQQQQQQQSMLSQQMPMPTVPCYSPYLMMGDMNQAMPSMPAPPPPPPLPTFNKAEESTFAKKKADKVASSKFASVFVKSGSFI